MFSSNYLQIYVFGPPAATSKRTCPMASCMPEHVTLMKNSLLHRYSPPVSRSNALGIHGVRFWSWAVAVAFVDSLLAAWILLNRYTHRICRDARPKAQKKTMWRQISMHIQVLCTVMPWFALLQGWLNELERAPRFMDLSLILNDSVLYARASIITVQIRQAFI